MSIPPKVNLGGTILGRLGAARTQKSPGENRPG
jgi:hypothetical protein